ncbi:MAG: hypothetical protein J1D99_06065, partial [Campylobacter sp.]|nr:hypothetical protein [Campylobacter sp.]
MQKQKILNLSFDIQRRQALEHLKNLGVLAFGGAMFYSLKPLENVFENLSLSKSQNISSHLNQILKLIV